ncbi:MAG: MBL fold metallo-hydrolase [Actinomycetota bacterium]|nr:MBL fold metallo-hydrolase [Actinomycetota bacterium]
MRASRGPAVGVPPGPPSTAAVTAVVDDGLGNSAYLVDLGDHRVLAVDPSRDLRGARRHLGERRVAFAADTHLHADFLTGARQLAATDGAAVLASAGGRREFAHTALADGDEVDLGGLRLRALGTPGHTDEHLAYLLLDGATPLGVFTGGSLLVGAVARTDLVDPDRTEELARAQYRSVQRLLALPDHVAVWPTHGAGSFCSAPARGERTSTIGRERATNPLLAMPDEESFVKALTGALGSFPAYFHRLAAQNRRGPVVLERDPELPACTPARVRALLAAGARLVDVRPAREFAAAHVPGSLSIPLRPAFATWLGWVVPADRPIVLLRGAGQDPAEVAWQAAKIGYDDILGELAGGIDAWRSAGYDVRATASCSPDAGAATRVLDVRQRAEFRSGHLPGAVHVEVGELAERAATLPRGPLTLMCAHGERAMTAASLLERAGRTDVRVVLDGGVDQWAARHAVPLEREA